MAQKKIEVEIEGTSPLLMNTFHIEALEQTSNIEKGKKTNAQRFGTPQEQAEKSAYWMSNKHELCIPSKIIMGTMKNAAKQYSIKGNGRSRISLVSILAGAIHIEPFEIPLGTSKYEIDIQGVVVQHARVARARAKLSKWKGTFAIFYDEELIEDPSVLKEILGDAGRRIGIMDFRPQRGGPFGCFKVTKFS